MKIIVNSTPIIALSLINQLDLLNQLFNEVIIPWFSWLVFMQVIYLNKKF